MRPVEPTRVTMATTPTAAPETPRQRSLSVLEAKVRSQKWDWGGVVIVEWWRGKGRVRGTYQEEVVGEDGDGEDVDELPAEEVALGEAGGFDQAGVDVDLDADGDGGDEDEAHDHGSLDVVGEEGNFETSDGCIGMSVMPFWERMSR
jgi:hypothetical protein